MFKSNSFFDLKDKHSKRLKLAKSSKDRMRIEGVKSQHRQQKYLSAHSSSRTQKGGVVYAGKSIVVKSNYTVAGRRYKDGIASRKAVGSKAAASLQYMDNHGSKDIEDQNLSNIYDENGDRLTKEELKDLLNSLRNDEENQSMRRTMIDIGQNDLTREELSQIVRDSMFEFMESTDKNFDFKYAIHTNTEQIHAHILSTGDAKDIMINREQLQELKLIIAEKTEQVIQQRELNLDNKIDKMIEKVIEEEKEKSISHSKETEQDNKDKSLTHSQQIDKEIDGKLDDKFREEELDKIINELYNNNQKDNSQSLSL